MADKFKFKINMEAEITFSPKTSDWFADLNTHEEYGDSWKYKFSNSAHNGYSPGQGHVVFAPADLHEVIQRAGCRRGDTVMVGKVEDPQDSRRNIWVVKKGGQVFSSRDDSGPALTPPFNAALRQSSGQAQGPPPPSPPGQPAAPQPPAHSEPASQPAPAGGPPTAPQGPPPQEEAGPPPGHPAASGNGNTRTASSETPAVIGATYVVAFKVARTALALAGINPTDDQVATTGRGLVIDLGRAGWKPRPEKVGEFIQAMKVGSASKPSGAALRQSSGQAQGPPAGSDPIGMEGYFVLLQEAQDGGVPVNALNDHMAATWRAFLRLAPGSPLPQHGPDPDWQSFPEALASDVTMWIEAKAGELAEAAPQGGRG